MNPLVLQASAVTAACFGLGWAVASLTRENPPPPQSPTRVSAPHAAVPESTAEISRADRALLEDLLRTSAPETVKALTAALSPEEAETAALALYATGRFDDKAGMLALALLERWSDGDPLAVFDWCRERGFPFGSQTVLPKILPAVARLRPERLGSFLDSARSKSVREMALSSLAGEDWAAPAEQFGFLMSQGVDGGGYAGTWLKRYAEDHPLEAAELALTVSAAPARATLLSDVIGGWSGRDPLTAARWAAERLGKGELGAELAVRAITTGFAGNPEEALRRLAEFSDPTIRAWGVGRVMENWAREDPAAALAAAEALPPEARTRAVLSIGTQAAARGQEAVRGALEAAPSRFVQTVIIESAVAENIAKDPAGVLRWTTGLPSPELRATAAARAWEAWTARDSAVAAAFALENPDAPGAEEGYAAAVRLTAATDPAKAAQMVEALPPARRAAAAKALSAALHERVARDGNR